MTAGHVPPGHVHRLIRRTVERRDVDRKAFQLLHPVVGGAVQRHHVNIFLQQIDEGQEKAAIETILVEIVGHDIGGRHQCAPIGEEFAEQPGEDHRIGNIRDRKFVEA
ncbi:hypothetical protein D3C72_2030700 [compost metagenome]